MNRYASTPISLYLAMIVTAAVIAFSLLSGCCKNKRIDPVVLGSPVLLFDVNGASPYASTDFGRSAWPSVPGPLESIEETYFYQYTRDFQGNAFQERNSPVRVFNSVRRGMHLR